MGVQYYCRNEKRRQLVGNHPTLNGIDYLEVLDREYPEQILRQRTLLVRCLKAISADFGSSNVGIEGGVRVSPIGVLWAFRATEIPSGNLSAQEQLFFASLSDADHILVVRTDSYGDFSTYRLILTTSDAHPGVLDDFDPMLSHVDFSFKVECPSDFDCKIDMVCPPEELTEPLIDYLAKDYASFRRAMLDRLAVIMPDWEERNTADVGIVLVELMAYAADHLSYYQDAVATEAYLGTARKRVSVRRHARLLDYPMHDGCNARAWVNIQVGGSADGATIPKGTQFLTKVNAPRGPIHPDELEATLVFGPEVFEAMHDITLRAEHNEMRFYTWGDEECCLPKGATFATLENRGDQLQNLCPGDVLIFEEVIDPETGEEANADPARRHVVRLTQVDFGEDPLFTEDEAGTQPLRVVNIGWSPEDALPFPLCLQELDRGAATIVRGNVVLVDHGRTISGEMLDEAPEDGRYQPRLQYGPLTQQGSVTDEQGELVTFDPEASASAALNWEMRDILPAISVIENGDTPWDPRRDLLDSDRFDRHFVVETEDDGTVQLRFGDDVLGRKPARGTDLSSTYRIGNGSAGNVGAEAIAHIVTNLDGITDVRNPLPAMGGVEPESIDQVKLYAPQAFRTQERAVTAEDYAEVTERHPEVQKAMVTLRWTGSWHTMFITVDRKGGLSVDAEFEEELRLFLERFRMAGYDLEIDGPIYVPLDIAFTVCVAQGYFASDVKQALLETFSNADLPDGSRGFFHPDNFTFGQPVYLSQLVSTAMQIPGVQWIDVDDTPPKPNRFRRWGEASRGELEDGMIEMERLEIARLDNDLNAPENGRIEFFMKSQ